MKKAALVLSVFLLLVLAVPLGCGGGAEVAGTYKYTQKSADGSTAVHTLILRDGGTYTWSTGIGGEQASQTDGNYTVKDGTVILKDPKTNSDAGYFEIDGKNLKTGEGTFVRQ